MLFWYEIIKNNSIPNQRDLNRSINEKVVRAREEKKKAKQKIRLSLK